MPDRTTALTAGLVLALLLSCTLVVPNVASAVTGQVYDLGTPTADGSSVRVPLSSPADYAALTFAVRGAGPSRVELYVGDQWYDVDASLYRRGQAPNLTEGDPIVVLERSERRRIQFISPEEALLPAMPPGEYVLVVGHKYAATPELATDFVPGRDVLVRVAVGGSLCTLAPPGDPAAGAGSDDAQYHVGLAVEPSSPGRTSLLTFTAVVSPPFTDLFDYTWTVDGVPVDGATGPIYQRLARELGSAARAQHTVTLTARGAREYHDPTEPRFSHLPLDGGTVVASCTFGLDA